MYSLAQNKLSLGSSLALHDIVRLRDLSQDMEISMTQIDNMTSHKSELQGKHKVCHGCPHNLQTVKEIHFIPKLDARKTISKMGPGVPWPDSYRRRAGRLADGGRAGTMEGTKAGRI
jgi:hypothetical protein